MLDRHQLTSDLLLDYALGHLTPGEEAEVEAALERYPEVRQEADLYLGNLADMVMDLEPAPVPAGAADRLLARLNAEVLSPEQPGLPQPRTPEHTEPNLTFSPAQTNPVRPRRNWLYPLIAVAAAAAIVVAVLPGLTRGPDTFAGYQARPGAVTTTLNDKEGATVARVVRLPGGQAYVQMQASVPAGRAYQAWKIEGGKPVSLGMFKGQEYTAQLAPGTVFAVTVEPAGGSAQPTSAPLFASAI